MSIDDALRAALEAANAVNWGLAEGELAAYHDADVPDILAAFREALDERGLRITPIDLNANDEFAAGWRHGMRLGRRLAFTGHQGGLGGNPLGVTKVDRIDIRTCACGASAFYLTVERPGGLRPLCMSCYHTPMPSQASQEPQDEQLMLEATEIPYKRPSPTSEPENADLGVSIARAIARSKR